MKKNKRGRRLSTAAKLTIAARNDSIVRLRELNVPVATIAAQFGVSQHRVRKVLHTYYQQNAEWLGVSEAARKFERERQLEFVDAQLMRVVVLDPRDPAALTAAGVGLRDWLSFAETSRRVKGDLVRLHALEGQTAVSEPKAGGPTVVEGDPVSEARVLHSFLLNIRSADPALYDRIASVLSGRPGPQAPAVDLPISQPPAEPPEPGDADDD